jgi:putative acetyltransferase
LSVSLVAIVGSALVGQITFSPASVSSDRGQWYALGPVSVAPERQREGIGGALIDAGMKAIESLGAAGCILTGDPVYYSRRGFALAPEHCPESEPEEYFMLRLTGVEQPVGTFAFHEAFYEGA